jgi:hypothetical protein
MLNDQLSQDVEYYTLRLHDTGRVGISLFSSDFDRVTAN